MARPRTGSVRVRKGIVYVRVSYLDENGKQRWIEKRAPNKEAAPALIRRLTNDLDRGGLEFIDGERMTFVELAAKYKEHRIFPAVYSGDRKIAGLRDSRTTALRLEILISYFGRKRIRAIAPGDLERFKRDRLATPARFGKDKKRSRPRSLTTVNRELQILRSILYYAEREGWIVSNPFKRVQAIISSADEIKRNRILSQMLLLACEGARDYLRPLIITALDTGMRLGELTSLT